MTDEKKHDTTSKRDVIFAWLDEHHEPGMTVHAVAKGAGVGFETARKWLAAWQHADEAVDTAAAAEFADDPVAADAPRASGRSLPGPGPSGSPRHVVTDFAERAGEAAKRPPGMIGAEKRGQAIEHQTGGDTGEERGQDDDESDRGHRHVEPGRESPADAEHDGAPIGRCEARRGVSGGAVGPRHHHPCN